MRYSQIKPYDTTNGEGVRVSLWTQGCSVRCPHCFNEITWDFKGGIEFTEETANQIKDLLRDRQFVKRDFSVLGGEPLEKVNIKPLTKLLMEIKEEFPDVSIWIWTSHLFEEVCELDLMNYVDVMVDGRFEIVKRDKRLKWRGSSNQRVIDVPASLKKEKIVLYLN